MLCRRCRWSSVGKMLCCRECHGRSSLRILVLGGVFSSSLADAWPSAEFLADALPLLALGPFFGRCFVVESVWTLSLADTWPPWSLGLRWRMLCRCCCWMLLCLIRVDALPPRLCLSCRQLLRFIFIAGSVVGFGFIPGHSSLSWWFVICATRVLL
jgi:hypothetical protein